MSRWKYNVFIVGDGADAEFSGMAQTALDHGHLVAENIVRHIQGRIIEMYYPEEPIYAIPVGNDWAAVSMHGMHFYGRTGWYIRRFLQLQFFLSILPLSKALIVWGERTEFYGKPARCAGERLFDFFKKLFHKSNIVQ